MKLESSEHPSALSGTSTVALVVLVLVALVLAYFLYQQVTDTAAPAEYTETPNTAADTPAEPQLSADERAALSYPSDVTEEGWKAYLATVAKVAVAGGTLIIGPRCTISPVALTVKRGAEVTLHNTDTVPHSIGFTESLMYKAPANGTLTESSLFQIPADGTVVVPIDFMSTAGVYGYSCDQGRVVGGILQVTE